MKSYSKSNYQRYKKELSSVRGVRLNLDDKSTIINNYLYLPEYIARRFPLAETSCGRLNIEDLIQEGMVALVLAVEMVDADVVKNSTNQDLILKSYLTHKIKGAIKRAVINSRGTIRLPERVVREIRSGDNTNENAKSTYFGNVLKRIEDDEVSNNKIVVDFNGDLIEYSYPFVVAYLLGVLKPILNELELKVVRQWYGIGMTKQSLGQIAKNLGDGLTEIKVFEIKKAAKAKIDESINRDKVMDFLF